MSATWLPASQTARSGVSCCEVTIVWALCVSVGSAAIWAVA